MSSSESEDSNESEFKSFIDSTATSVNASITSADVTEDLESNTQIQFFSIQKLSFLTGFLTFPGEDETETQTPVTKAKASRIDDTPDKNLEIPETDSEASSSDDELRVPRKTTAKNRIADTDESSDEEEKLRKSMYEAESDSDGHVTPIEEKAFSKATRRSINGFRPCSSIVPNSDDGSGDDSDSIIVEDSKTEKEDKSTKVESTYENSKGLSEDSTIDISDSDEVEVKPSVIRSPLKDVTMHRASVTNESFNSSINSKMSSTMTVKTGEYSMESLDEAAGVIEKIKVSPTQFEAAVVAKEEMERQVNTMLKALEMSRNLPDGGEKLKGRINMLVNEIEKKKELLESWEVDENKSIKNEIARSFESEHGAVVVDDSLEFKQIENIKPAFTGKIGMKIFNTQKALTVGKLEDIQQSIEARPLETVFATPPKHLKVTLMNHQLHAIAFMLWREQQNPRGGLLADDMGKLYCQFYSLDSH